MILDFKHGLIVSCQAEETEPLYGSEIMQKMAVAAIQGGAKGIRANTPQDIKAIRQITDLPIIGIFKDRRPDYEAYITITCEEIDEVINAGADIVAIDSIYRSRPEPLEKLYRHCREKYPHIKILADISSVEDVKKILTLKPDYISTTLSGYTAQTCDRSKPDIHLIREITELTDIPVIAEGNYFYPEQVRMAILNGAYAVVVGGAISRPQQTTARFVKHISDLPSSDITAVGVDLGGTWTRSVLTDMYGNILKSYRQETPKNAASVLACIEKCIEKVIDGKTTAIGIASAGRIDFKNGKVLYASDNLPGWTGTEVKKEIEKVFKIRTVVDNDANMAAYMQWFKEKDGCILYITVGTGIGSGIVVNGKVMRGVTGSAGEIGHIVYPLSSNSCTCGKKGCIETVLSGRYLSENLSDINNPINKKDQRILSEYCKTFAWLVDTLKNTIDFDAVYIGGVLPRYGSFMLESIRREFEKINLRNPGDIIKYSTVGEEAGSVGAALCSLFIDE
ncbi:MAG TPA: putative N-acetylmannosamine-6-phosphate 2-epimerase [Petrotogaceae bacterium]|nr:putative N-acetylmannosamine-6-phosphate 2-epimerase [Petrotogaceae bacterium]HOG35359.1 putative N-acetylmannosamine-6-phosphate 2-epimerase [Petrotogaceae bacterium]